MTPRARNTVIGAAALAAMFWAGTRLGGAHETAAPARERVVERAAAPVVVHESGGGGGGLTREDLRAIVREELAAHGGSAAPVDPDSPAAQERAEQLKTAVAAARVVVAGGIEHHTWGKAERDAIREQLIVLGRDEQLEVLKPLFQAINAQQVELDGPPI